MEEDPKDTDIEAQYWLWSRKYLEKSTHYRNTTTNQRYWEPSDLFQKDLQDLAWIDAEEDPWEYGMQQGCIYNI